MFAEEKGALWSVEIGFHSLNPVCGAPPAEQTAIPSAHTCDAVSRHPLRRGRGRPVPGDALLRRAATAGVLDVDVSDGRAERRHGVSVTHPNISASTPPLHLTLFSTYALSHSHTCAGLVLFLTALARIPASTVAPVPSVPLPPSPLRAA